MYHSHYSKIILLFTLLKFSAIGWLIKLWFYKYFCFLSIIIQMCCKLQCIIYSCVCCRGWSGTRLRKQWRCVSWKAKTRWVRKFVTLCVLYVLVETHGRGRALWMWVTVGSDPGLDYNVSSVVLPLYFTSSTSYYV